MLSFTYKGFVLDVDHICFTASIQKYLDDITSFLNKKKKDPKHLLQIVAEYPIFLKLLLLLMDVIL